MSGPWFVKQNGRRVSEADGLPTEDACYVWLSQHVPSIAEALRHGGYSIECHLSERSAIRTDLYENPRQSGRGTAIL